MTNNEHKAAPTVAGLTDERILAALASLAPEVPVARLPPGLVKFARAIEREVRADVERWAASHAGASAVPEGYVLMPKRLTPEMKAVIKDVAPRWNAESIYANLRAAAPVPAADGGNGGEG